MTSVLTFCLGRVPYLPALTLQKNIVNLIKSSSNTTNIHCILLLEHTPVYTIGVRRKDPANDYEESGIRKLRNLGAEFVKTDRGGLITYHGPGQLVAYPIINLRCKQLRGRGLRWYVHALEQAGISLCARYGLDATAGGDSDTGVWLDADHKLMAIGIHQSHSITYHGVSINLSNEPLFWLRQIIPCGLIGRDVTSLSEACHRPIEMCELMIRFHDCLLETLFQWPIVQYCYRQDLARDWSLLNHSCPAETSLDQSWSETTELILNTVHQALSETNLDTKT